MVRIINYTRNKAPPKINIAEECKLQQIEDDSESNDSEHDIVQTEVGVGDAAL